MGPNVLIRREKFGHRNTDTQRRPCRTEAEMGVMHLEAKNSKDSGNHQKLGERHGTDPSLEPAEGAWPYQTP